MDHYLEIRLLPDPEFSPSLLMNALFAKFHRRLVDIGSNDIGVSFPEVSSKPTGLGGRLRLHGSEPNLEQLMADNWLTGMADHIRIAGPVPVPVEVGYRVVRRVQAKSSPERLRRRLMKRQDIDEEAACRMIPDHLVQHLELPFLRLKSRSTGQSFRVFVDHLPVVTEPTSGPFSNYGLSPIATVPWF